MHRDDVGRRGFLGAALGSLPLLVIPGAATARAPRRREPLDPDLVLEFVSAAHTDLDKTKSMVEKRPALVLASWDWGSGDWETGLGGAAHSGSTRIVRYLLANGARMDLFAAAVIGEVAIVRAVLEAFPGLLDVKGPHGIPLYEHAKAGGRPAEPVVKYLETLGAKDREVTYVDLPVSASEQKRYLGMYDADLKPGLTFEVTLKDGRLHGQPKGSPKLALYFQGGGVFWAPDAEAKISFGLQKDRAETVRLQQFDLNVTATRREQ